MAHSRWLMFYRRYVTERQMMFAISRSWQNGGGYHHQASHGKCRPPWMRKKYDLKTKSLGLWMMLGLYHSPRGSGAEVIEVTMFWWYHGNATNGGWMYNSGSVSLIDSGTGNLPSVPWTFSFWPSGKLWDLVVEDSRCQRFSLKIKLVSKFEKFW